jgi:hypothetical protein
MIKMPKEKPIQAVGLKWKESSYDCYFGGIQIILSNGVTSPVFLAKDEKNEDF